MNSLSSATRFAILFLFALLLPSCDRQDRPLGERARDAAEETAEELKEGAGEVRDALDEAGEKIRKGVEKAEEAWEE